MYNLGNESCENDWNTEMERVFARTSIEKSQQLTLPCLYILGALFKVKSWNEGEFGRMINNLCVWMWSYRTKWIQHFNKTIHTITMVALNSATKPVLFTNITYPAMLVYLLLSLFDPNLVRNRLDRFCSNWHKPVFSPARFTTLILAKTVYFSRFLSFLFKPRGSGSCQNSGFKMNYCTSLRYFAMISYKEFPWERWESD